MRLRLGVKFEAGKFEIDPFQDEKDDNSFYITDIKSEIWSTNYKLCTKSNLNTLIDEKYEELNTTFENLNDALGGSKWIIY